jgi:hypothetical protein
MEETIICSKTLLRMHVLSCETQLLTFTQEMFDSMAGGKQTDVAVMDFSKAFDKVDHQRLILKLKRMGQYRTTI